MSNAQVNVGRFFDQLSTDYTSAIERCFPRYREMLWALLDYLPQDRTFDRILELGCGTGNLSVLLTAAYPTASFRFVDVSVDSLEICRTRLGTHDRVEWDPTDFRDLQLEPNSFDLVISSISVHHLRSNDKQQLFGRIRAALKPQGVFTFADQFRGATDQLYEQHVSNWRALSLSAGATTDEFAMWMQHQQDHDHHDSLSDQMDWLRQSGFPIVDCTWRYLLWSVVQARIGSSCPD